MDRLICIQVDQEIDLPGIGALLVCIFSSEIKYQYLHAFQVQYLWQTVTVVIFPSNKQTSGKKLFRGFLQLKNHII